MFADQRGSLQDLDGQFRRVIAASALGGFAGSALGGVLADAYGFNAVNWMGAAAAALSVVVLVLALLPAARAERDPDDEAPDSRRTTS